MHEMPAGAQLIRGLEWEQVGMWQKKRGRLKNRITLAKQICKTDVNTNTWIINIPLMQYRHLSKKSLFFHVFISPIKRHLDILLLAIRNMLGLCVIREKAKMSPERSYTRCSSSGLRPGTVAPPLDNYGGSKCSSAWPCSRIGSTLTLMVIKMMLHTLELFSVREKFLKSSFTKTKLRQSHLMEDGMFPSNYLIDDCKTGNLEGYWINFLQSHLSWSNRVFTARATRYVWGEGRWDVSYMSPHWEVEVIA